MDYTKNKILMLHGIAPRQDNKSYAVVDVNTYLRPRAVH